MFVTCQRTLYVLAGIPPCSTPTMLPYSTTILLFSCKQNNTICDLLWLALLLSICFPGSSVWEHVSVFHSCLLPNNISCMNTKFHLFIIWWTFELFGPIFSLIVLVIFFEILCFHFVFNLKVIQYENYKLSPFHGPAAKENPWYYVF